MQRTQQELIANILSALGHPNRIRILEYLKDGIKCNNEISSALELEQSNLSRHLKILVQEGILISWKDGLKVDYKVSDPQVFDILSAVGNVARKEANDRIKILEKV